MSTLLSVDDISISFGGIKAVQHATFDIRRNEILGLIGPNGSGKSTCVNLITGVYPLDTGTITFDGHKLGIKEGIVERSRLGLSRTFQSPKPFSNLTVYDNIFTIALLNNNFINADKKTKDILVLTRLESVSQLQSSELPIEKRKWLDLARILATDPKIIMMDEVLAGLNPSEMEESLQLVRDINQQGITILFIEHVMKAVVGLCNRVVVLNEGSVLCEGIPSEVLKRPDVIAAYIGGGGKDDA